MRDDEGVLPCRALSIICWVRLVHRPGFMSDSGYTFILADWRNDAAAIRAVREPVLIAELGMRPELLDLPDESEAFHVLAYDSGSRAVGAARMRRDGRIDYVTVLRPWRGRTVGGALLTYLHHIAFARGIEHLWGMIPETARRFFEKNQFVVSAEMAPDAEPGRQKFVRAVSKPDLRPPLH